MRHAIKLLDASQLVENGALKSFTKPRNCPRTRCGAKADDISISPQKEPKKSRKETIICLFGLYQAKDYRHHLINVLHTSRTKSVHRLKLTSTRTPERVPPDQLGARRRKPKSPKSIKKTKKCPRPPQIVVLHCQPL